MIKKALSGLIRFFLYFIAILPFPVVYAISDVFFVLLYYVAQYRRNVVSTNVNNAFPEKTEQERKQIEKKFYAFLADQILESVKMLTISKEEIKKRFRINNLEVMTRHFDSGRSVLAASGHYANWEWGSLIISASIKEKVLVVYKPLTDKSFEGLMNHMRSRFGSIMVAMKATLRKIVSMKKDIYLAIFVSDQTPVREEATYFTSFLNQPTAVFLGIEKIAKLTNNPVVFCHLNCIKRGYYEVTFKEIANESKFTADFEITEAHTRELENIIRQKPELWLWSHRRWKVKPEEPAS